MSGHIYISVAQGAPHGPRQTLGGARTERGQGSTTRTRSRPLRLLIYQVYEKLVHWVESCPGTLVCGVWGAAVQQSEKFRHARKTYKNVAKNTKLQNLQVSSKGAWETGLFKRVKIFVDASRDHSALIYPF